MRVRVSGGASYDPETNTFVLIGKVTDARPTGDMVGIEFDADHFAALCAAGMVEVVTTYRSARKSAMAGHDDVAAHTLRGGAK